MYFGNRSYEKVGKYRSSNPDTSDERSPRACGASVEALIAEEETMLKRRIIGEYVEKSLGDISLKEYGELMLEENAQKRNEVYYEGLRCHLRGIRMSSHYSKCLDMERISAARFAEAMSALSRAATVEERERIEKELLRPYFKRIAE